MKKLWTGAFCALTAVLLAGTVSAAYDITASGDEWTLEGNGTLYITGTISLEAEGWEEYDSQIKKVVLTADAGWMPDGVFVGCTALEEFVVEDGCTSYIADDGVLYQVLAKDSLSLECYPAAKTDAEYTVLADISDWAETAMRWVTAEEIYEGYDDELRPKQNAPRALVAQMLYNYAHKDDDTKDNHIPMISKLVEPDWGLTLTASNVTNTGMTLTFTQSGGNPTGERLSSGWFYFLETFDGIRWIKVPQITEQNAWTDEGWTIPLNGEFTIDVSWDYLYGELPAGQYRMGKNVDDFRKPGDYDYATFYAEFTIPDTGMTSANLDGFSYEESNRCYVTYPGEKRVEIERGHITLFVNGSVIEYEDAYLQDGVPVVLAKLVCDALSIPYDADTMTEEMRADVLAETLGAEYRYFDTTDRKKPYLYLSGKHVMIDKFDDTVTAKTEDEAAAHLKEVLTIAYETRYGEEFAPAESPVEGPAAPYNEQLWHRYHIATMGEDNIMFELGRYYMIPYVWDFYVDKYTDDVYMMYNGIVNRISKYDPTLDGALAFAG